MDDGDATLRRAVHEALEEAIESHAWIIVYLRGDPKRQPPIREIPGVPLCFLPGKDGSERLVLSVVPNETEQIVRVDRIVRVAFRKAE